VYERVEVVEEAVSSLGVAGRGRRGKIEEENETAQRKNGPEELEVGEADLTPSPTRLSSASVASAGREVEQVEPKSCEEGG